MKEIRKARIKQTGEIVEVEKTIEAVYRDTNPDGWKEPLDECMLEFVDTPTLPIGEDLRQLVEKEAMLAACDCGDGLDEPAYDVRYYDGFKKGVEWLLKHQFQKHIAKGEEISLVDAFSTTGVTKIR